MAPKKKQDEDEIRMVDISLIDSNSQNPRRIQDDAEFESLVRSIKARGILQSLTISPRGKRFRVVAGERRLLAGREAGLTHVPAIIKIMTDEEAYEASVAENINRADMNPADECEAVRRMVQDGSSRAEIASRFGKSIRWVASREKIAGLGDDVLDMIRDRSLPLAHAEELCKLGSEEQIDMIASKCRTWGLDQLRRHVEDMLRDLSKAAFRLDTKYGALPPCSKCPNRSDKQTDLFGTAVKGSARCMDRACWESKTAAFVEKIKEEKTRAGFTLVPSCDEYHARFGYGDYTNDEDTIAKMQEAGLQPRILVEMTGEVKECWYEPDMPEVETENESNAGNEDGDGDGGEERTAKNWNYRVRNEFKRLAIEAAGAHEIDFNSITRFIAEALRDNCSRRIPLDDLVETVESGRLHLDDSLAMDVRKSLAQSLVELMFNIDFESGLAIMEKIGLDKEEINQHAVKNVETEA